MRLFSFCLSLFLIFPVLAMADGTERLGQPSISVNSANSMLTAGVGLNSTAPAPLIFSVPQNATIRQVLLYWQESYGTCAGCPAVGDPTIILTPDGGEIVGTPIGGNNTIPKSPFKPVAYRADITARNLVHPGYNSFLVSGLSAGALVPEGTGVVVLYDLPGESSSGVWLYDGSDSVFASLSGDFSQARPVTFSFPSTSVSRVMDLSLFIAALDNGGGNYLKVSVEGEPPAFFNRPFGNIEGNRWDNITLPLLIPAGVRKVTVQPVSGTIDPALCSDFGNHKQDPNFLCPANPSSMVWLFAGARLSDSTSPVCHINGPFDLICGGSATRVTLSAEGSFSPAGARLQYSWSTDCGGATLSSTSGTQSTILSLTQPSAGIPQTCTATLTITDGTQSSQCSTRVSSTACGTDCAGQLAGKTVPDSCGICGGSNACLDCSGSTAGVQLADACGICGGTNACLAPKSCGNDVLTSELRTVTRALNAQKTFLKSISAAYGNACGKRKRNVVAKQRKTARDLSSRSSAISRAQSRLYLLRRSCSRRCRSSDNRAYLKSVRNASSSWLRASWEIDGNRGTCAEGAVNCIGDSQICASERAGRLAETEARRAKASTLYRQVVGSLAAIPPKTYRCPR